MEQMTLFDSERPYKYIMDTSSILSQKPGETHTRLVYKSQWERIEEYMRSHSIVTCSEIFEEIKDKEIKEWIFSQQCTVLEIDDDIQNNVRKIVTENPKMIEFTGKKRYIFWRRISNCNGYEIRINNYHRRKQRQTNKDSTD